MGPIACISLLLSSHSAPPLPCRSCPFVPVLSGELPPLRMTTFLFLVSHTSPAFFLLRLIFFCLLFWVFFLRDKREKRDKAALLARAGRLLSIAVSEVSQGKESTSASLDNVNNSPLADNSSLLVSLACGRPGLFRLDLHLASESVPRCCFYCLMHLDSISNTCLPPPNGLFYTHTHTRIHQRHLLWFLLYSGTRQRGGTGRVIIIVFMPGGGFHCILFWVHWAVRPHTFLFQTKTRKKTHRESNGA